MNSQALKISCEELREASDDNPDEMDVIMDMMMEADEEIDGELELTTE